MSAAVPVPELSVITPTVGRPEAMRAKLASLERQTLAPARFEWLVCLNGPPEPPPPLAATAALLAAAAPPFALAVLPSGRALGPGGARNVLLARARGALLLLSDDDCLLPPDLLERHLAAQRRAPGVWLGAILFVADDRRALWRPRRPGPWQLNGANSSAPRAAVAAVGGFPELPGYGGEDLLLGARLARAGLPVAALPGAPVRHLGPDPRWGRDPAKARSAGANAARIARSEPALAWRLGVHPLQRALKRAVLGGPLGRLLAGALGALGAAGARAALGYERAYLAGAEAGPDPTPTDPPSPDRGDP